MRGAVLHRCRHPVGERRPRHRPAMPAALGMRPGARSPPVGSARADRRPGMGDRRSRLGRVQKRRAASLAGKPACGPSPDPGDRGGAAILALMAGLPAGLAARFAAQASGSPLRPRLLQPIARRRLATVAAVEAKTTLQLLDALDEDARLALPAARSAAEAKRFPLEAGCSPLPDGRSSVRAFRALIPRRRAARRLGIAHAAVESFPEIPVNPFTPIPTETRLNSLAQNDKSDDLGSLPFVAGSDPVPHGRARHVRS